MHTTEEDVSASVNSAVYGARRAVDEYTYYTLTRVETMTFLKYQPFIAGKTVLDIGVGAGRTSVYLAPLAKRYEGIDYSPAMVEYMQTAMPEISIRQSDMRKLDSFPADKFDFIFASNNVLDDVSHEGRLQTLAEFRRVLRAGGMLVFLAHNRLWEHTGTSPRLGFSRNPIRLVKSILLWLKQLANHAKIGKMRVVTAEYAIYNDEGHDFSALHYYIEQSIQRRQLSENGFSVVDVLDTFGSSITEQDAAKESPSLMYVARKMG